MKELTEGSSVDLSKNVLLQKAFRDKPEFSLHKIEAFDEDSFREIKEFFKEEYWCQSDSINVFDVTGTRHPDYQGMTWLDFLKLGKRMKLNLSLFEDKPGYYLETDLKLPFMSYIKIDSKTYVDADGNHRTCIAKFYFYYTGRTNLHGVTVREYITDRITYRHYKELKELLKLKKLSHIEVSPFREKLSRKDTAGWMREYFRVGVKVRNIRTDEVECLFEDKIVEFMESVRTYNLFRRLYPRSYFDRFLR